MIHILYISVTLFIGVLIGWKTYPYISEALRRILNKS